jgi:sodium/potassium/calcium exchanger 6
MPRAVALWKRSVPTFDVHDTSDASETPSYIPYYELYSSIKGAHGRALAFVALVLWLVFLFASVGIVASDFFCPNLGTLSGRMGMSEGVVSAVWTIWLLGVEPMSNRTSLSWSTSGVHPLY